MKKKNNFSLRDFNKWVAIPIGLVGFWCILSIHYIFQYDLSFSILSENFSKNSFANLEDGKLLQSEPIRGQITPSDNHFGILSIRFHTSKLVQDNVIFRLKEVGETKWYYETRFNAEQFIFLPEYPFGFPPISNSSGKTYEFELESTNGSLRNAISISNEEPVIIAKYKYPRNLILLSKESFTDFFIKKFSYVAKNTFFAFFSFVYALPLILYYIWQRWLGAKVRPHLNPTLRYIAGYFPAIRQPLAIIVIAIILTDIFFVPGFDDLASFTIIISWSISSMAGKLRSMSTFIVALLLGSIIPIAFAFDDEAISTEAATWVYYFLIMGALQGLMELRTAKKYNK